MTREQAFRAGKSARGCGEHGCPGPSTQEQRHMSTWGDYGLKMQAWAKGNPAAAQYAVSQACLGPPRPWRRGEAVGRWFQANPGMSDTLRDYDPAQSQTAPYDDEADLEALRETMRYFAERPGSWEAAVGAGMPEYTPAMSPVEYSRQLAPFLEAHPSVLAMLDRWPTQEQMGLVGQPWSKHPLDQVDVNDPEEVLKLFKRGQERDRETATPARGADAICARESAVDGLRA